VIASTVPATSWFLYEEVGYLWMDQPNQSMGQMLNISYSTEFIIEEPKLCGSCNKAVVDISGNTPLLVI
jgi:hypothetical protein